MNLLVLMNVWYIKMTLEVTQLAITVNFMTVKLFIGYP